MAAKKILILEDDKVLGDVLVNKLREEGYDMTWELDGEAGLRTMRATKPDLVLLDIVMPKKNGYEVLEDKKADDTIRDIPVVIISNSGQPVEIERIIGLGARDYVIKAHFSPDEVLEKVRKQLGDPVKEPADAAPSAAANKAKVLVVEDDPFLSSLCAGQLSKVGYTVSSVPDGEQALRFFETTVPDLVLLDIMMPGMNGFEVLAQIRANERLKHVAVVVFSNLGQDHEIEQARQLGADDFLVKAKFTLSEVVKRIEEILKKKQMKAA